MRDTLGDGRALRAFTLVDDCTREASAIEVDFLPPGARVAAVLDGLAPTPSEFALSLARKADSSITPTGLT